MTRTTTSSSTGETAGSAGGSGTTTVGGSGGGGGVSSEVIVLDNKCPEPRPLQAVGPESAENDTVVLGRFAPTLDGAHVTNFRWFRINEQKCAPLDTEVIAFACSDPISESPMDVRFIPVPAVQGAQIVPVDVPVDPPLDLSAAAPNACIGVRLTAMADGSRTCVLTCGGDENGDADWWSTLPGAPFGWAPFKLASDLSFEATFVY